MRNLPWVSKPARISLPAATAAHPGVARQRACLTLLAAAGLTCQALAAPAAADSISPGFGALGGWWQSLYFWGWLGL